MRFDHKLAWEDESVYNEIYQRSIKDPEGFWAAQLRDIYWKKEPRCVFDRNLEQWIPGGISNVCYNCVDRHAQNTPDKPAIVWYGDEIGERREVSYSELLSMVVKIAAVLKAEGVQSDDVVGIYMPMIPEALAAMLACSRIGAMHLVVFAGFSPEALAYRLSSSKTKVLLTVTYSKRGGKRIEILNNANLAISKMESPSKIINLENIDQFNAPVTDEIYWQDSNDDLFVLYTSGSSGKPKGIVHSAFPYLLYAATTFKIIFGIDPDDVYFSTSDIGWITGHSYITYAPLFYGLTTVIFEGTPTYPTADRYWEIIENERVSIFYSAPTAIRSLQMFGDSVVKKHDLSSLKVLGSVGEPINESAWEWYFNVVGNKRCPIMDTWWQTETGGIMIAPLRNLNQKPSTAGKPFFGNIIQISNNGAEAITRPNQSGTLTILNNWPGRCRSAVLECEKSGNLQEYCRLDFMNLYFKNGAFVTGDEALYDADFDIKIKGRLDDVINISGHRLGTAEFECAINKVDGVKESAVVGVEHSLKGQAAFAYVVIDEENDVKNTISEILKSTKQNIGPIAKPDFIAFVPDLPKTRSGKIVRHLLKSIANGAPYDEKDISSIYNPEIIEVITEAANRAFLCPDVCNIKK